MSGNNTNSFTRRYTVRPEHAARHLETEGIRVLATPVMVGFIEETCRIFWDERLPPNKTTVGVRVDVSHVKPALVGSELEVKASVLYADEKRVRFWVEVWSGKLLIGYALHERAVIDKEGFANMIKTMMSSSAGG
ncbi:thioesterase [Infirmifilum uzonense]|uniref:Thioesterase n=1 Tax=Infirmifilum uzonense TaxID=1550241 RepID=A0A0F7FIC6_9CREN|nr:hotdog domain-containing protein [Infirmifilum uzonense]AKG38544.1 thioesterase [Infirmifilum uzonense]